MKMNRQAMKQTSLYGTGARLGRGAMDMRRVKDNLDKNTLSALNTEEVMERNAGHIVNNAGTVKINTFHGTVQTNHGAVRINGGRVETNHGRVRENSDVGMIMKNHGSVTVNRGDIGENHGKVTNSENGNVDTNVNGVVLYGQVGELLGGTATGCTIGRMTGGTARGVSTIIDSYEGGRVSKSVSRSNITLAPGVTDDDIKWVRALPSEKAAQQVS